MPIDDAALAQFIADFRVEPLLAARAIMQRSDMLVFHLISTLLEDGRDDDIARLLLCFEQGVMVNPLLITLIDDPLPAFIPLMKQRLAALFPDERALLAGGYDAHIVGERHLFSSTHDWLARALVKAGWQPDGLSTMGMAYWLVVEPERLLLDYGRQALDIYLWIGCGRHPLLVGQNRYGQVRFNENYRRKAAGILGDWLKNQPLPHILRDYLLSYANIALYTQQLDFYGDGEVETFRFADFWGL